MADKNWKEKAKEHYDEMKKKGKAFFPYIVYKDTLVAFILFIVLLFLAVKIGAGLEDIADPTDTTYNPRPEWYFLFLFQTLKFFPGSMEAVVAIILPSIGVLFLLLLPFIDRGPKRHPLDRPVLTTLGVLAIAGFLVMTYIGWKSPLLNPVVDKDPNVMAGRVLYSDLRCFYCHSINGKGGIVAPDLSTVGARRDRDWLTKHFQDPKSVTPGSLMPKLNLLPEEINQLAAYLETLGGGEGPFTSEAPKLFKDNCSTCHMLDGHGGDVGPDLSAVKTYRSKAYLISVIKDPQKMNPQAIMPSFTGQLTDAQIEDVARYLSSSTRKAAN